MDFGALFSRAARITWEHKVLWLLGFIVSLFGGGYGASNSFSSFSNFNTPSSDIPLDPVTGQPDLSQVFPFLPSGFDPNQVFGDGFDPGALLAALGTFLVALLCVGIFLSIVFALIQWLGQGALIGMVNEYEERGRMPGAGEGFGIGGRHFLRLFVIAFLLGLPGLLLVLVGILAFGAGISTFIASAAGGQDNINFAGLFGALGCLLPLICVAVILGWLLGLLRNLAVRVAVIEDQGVMDSLKRGWALFKGHIGEVLVIWIVLAIIGAVFSFLVGLPGIAIGLPVLMGINSGELSQSLISLSVLLACGYGIVVAALSSLLVVFASAVWTLAYRQFAGPMAAATTMEPVVEPA